MAKCCAEWMNLYYLNALFLATMQLLLGLVSCSLHGLTLYELMMRSKKAPPSFAAVGMIWSLLILLTGFVYGRWAMFRSRCNSVMTSVLQCIICILAIVVITLIGQKIPDEDIECNQCQNNACNPICRFNYSVWLWVLLGLCLIQIGISIGFYLMCFRYYQVAPQQVSAVGKEDGAGKTELGTVSNPSPEEVNVASPSRKSERRNSSVSV